MIKIKYPRTYHLPYSEKSSDDDKTLVNDDHFKGKEVVVSIKMDGENTTISKEYSHARSLDSASNLEGRNWIESLRTKLNSIGLHHEHRLCGENMFYKHTCNYNNLESMFYLHSFWDKTWCVGYDATTDVAKIYKLKMPDVIYRDIYDKDAILKAFNEYKSNSEDDVEGFVVRTAQGFEIDNFNMSFAKYVCKDFEIPNIHWTAGNLEQNKLKNNLNPWEIIW